MIKETRIGQHSSVKVDLTGLNNLIKTMDSQHVVRIGILGDKPRSKAKAKEEKEHKDPPTNAEIGLAHEKGVKSRNLPRRSWLQVPLEDHLPEEFIKNGPRVMLMMLAGNALLAYQDLQVICERIVEGAFDTGGYGKWKALELKTLQGKKSWKKLSSWDEKNNDQILVDTSQLRRSITSIVTTK